VRTDNEQREDIMKPMVDNEAVHRHRRAAAGVALGAMLAFAGCSSDGLDPDITIDDTDHEPPATDTRTVDPPTFSNLPVSVP